MSSLSELSMPSDGTHSDGAISDAAISDDVISDGEFSGKALLLITPLLNFPRIVCFNKTVDFVNHW